jgi:hypothetical protein
MGDKDRTGQRQHTDGITLNIQIGCCACYVYT